MITRGKGKWSEYKGIQWATLYEKNERMRFSRWRSYWIRYNNGDLKLKVIMQCYFSKEFWLKKIFQGQRRYPKWWSRDLVYTRSQDWSPALKGPRVPLEVGQSSRTSLAYQHQLPGCHWQPLGISKLSITGTEYWVISALLGKVLFFKK